MVNEKRFGSLANFEIPHLLCPLYTKKEKHVAHIWIRSEDEDSSRYAFCKGYGNK